MRARILLIPLLGTVSLLGVGLPAYAAQAGTATTATATGTTSQVTSHAVDHSASTVKAIAAYWTPQRMKEAIAASAPESSGSTPAATRPKTTAGADLPVDVNVLSHPTGAALPGPKSARPDNLATAVTQGRVFFHNGVTNVNASCSGGTVNTPNGDMVITAAHCVYANFSYMQDWIYVPGYYNGPIGYGTWFASNMGVTGAWKFNANPNDDFAIVNVAPASNGASLVKTAGGNGLVTDQSYNQNVVIWGYPGSYNNGLTPEYCITSTFQSGSMVGAPCNLSQGASGGPWLTSYNATTGLGYEFGETSTESASFTDNYSPYFGSDFITLYDQNVGL